jgi:hypothetical protein
MNTIKYRIKEWQPPFEKNFFTAQYKILGLWLNINKMQIGRFTKPSSTICETFEEAQNRVETHKLNMKRAGDVWGRCGVVVWEG